MSKVKKYIGISPEILLELEGTFNTRFYPEIRSFNELVEAFLLDGLLHGFQGKPRDLVDQIRSQKFKFLQRLDS